MTDHLGVIYQMKFYEKLKIIRSEKRISQAALARKAGVSKAVIGYWELNQRSPKLEQVIKIARALGVEWESLLDDDILDYQTELYKKEQRSLIDVYSSLNEKGRQMLSSIAQSLLLNPLYRNR